MNIIIVSVICILVGIFIYQSIKNIRETNKQINKIRIEFKNLDRQQEELEVIRRKGRKTRMAIAKLVGMNWTE